ncbi:MAG: protein kinase [Myxococcaceae bacterium]|nr:protein kinase [Myxococcaceae bacterium]
MSAPAKTFAERFQILRELGSGGMGVVFEALDQDSNQKVALKTLKALNPHALLRFKNEFREFQDLHHPNLISLGELFSEDGEWFFTMELVRGVDLLQFVRNTDTPLDANADTLVRTPTPETETWSGPDGSPDGRKAIAPPRYSKGFDEARLRAALRQLAEGLHALHTAGKVHRDVKPSNVLVTPEGRVVLLDFGLAIDVTRREWSPDDNSIVGTVAYMAPEQAAAQPATAASDWHAFGVLLYEALTGQLPYSGTSMEILSRKQTDEAPPPQSIVEGLPVDLCQLAMELLRFSPGMRPTGAEVLAWLGRRDEQSQNRRGSSRSLTSLSSSSLGPGGFVGREAELSALDQVWDQVCNGTSWAVTVSGESGLGKTALMRHFTQTVARDGAAVLLSTCYERETVPYKAVDGAIDALSRHLLRLPPKDAAALLPRNAALLAQAFPVLGQLEAFIQAGLPVNEVKDPLELRRRLFAALRELLVKLGQKQPVVLVVDDCQWADADSLALLSEVLRPPGGPRLLLLCTMRSTDPQEVAAWSERWAQVLGEHVRTLPLQRMTGEEGRTLAETLLRSVGMVDPTLAQLVATEGAGHPLFIDELLRQGSRESGHNEPLTLEEALWRRTTQLDVPARTVLELVALCVGRTQQQTIAQAAGIDRAVFSRLMGQLRVAHLVRTNGLRATDVVEPFHDKVRVAVRAHLEPMAAQRHHQRLAVALESAQSDDPEALSFHWKEAGEKARAGFFAELAAEKAFRALAFDRAAGFLQTCLELSPPDPSRDGERLAKLGDALAKAGRGAEAAEAMLKAVRTAAPGVALDLSRSAAEQLLRSGHIDRGLATIGEVLGVVGIKLASSPRTALASLLLSRARLSMRPLTFKETEARLVSPEALIRIDATWSAAAGLSMVDPIRASDIQTRNLLLALKAGEPYRVARGLAMEAGFAATGGNKKEAQALQLVERSAAIAERLQNPHAIGLASLVRGVVAFQNGRWARACESFRNAETIFRTQCVGVSWELESSTMFRLESTFYLGDLPGLQEGVRAQLVEAEGRGDLFATTTMRLAHMNAIWLAEDTPGEARREADLAMSRWSARGYLAQHWYYLIAAQNNDLYRGDGASAWKRIQEQWTPLDRSMLLRVQVVRVEALHQLGRAAVAAGKLKEAKDTAGKLEREGPAWATALATLLRASAEERPEVAIETLGRAAEQLDQVDMKLYAAAARWHRAGLVGGEAGKAERHSVTEALKQQGVVNVEHMVRGLVPRVQA